MLKIAWSEIYNHPLPENHRFPMIKYDLIPEQLLYEGTINSSNIFTPTCLDDEVVLKTHCSAYYQKLLTLDLTKTEERKTGFPLTEDLVVRERIIAGGTLQCAIYAQKYGIAMNVAGGTHHAFTDRGEGFCLLNDMAIAANDLLENHNVRRILIVDLDVHQGNGTAEIFKNDNRVFTFSMHGERNYPLKKERSDLDIALKDGTTDERYLQILEKQLNKITDAFQPDFIFYQSGVDVLESDKLGRLALTLRGCRQRDELIIKAAHRAKTPLVISMGGGYSYKLREIVEAHANTFRLAQEIYY